MAEQWRISGRGRSSYTLSVQFMQFLAKKDVVTLPWNPGPATADTLATISCKDNDDDNDNASDDTRKGYMDLTCSIHTKRHRQH